MSTGTPANRPPDRRCVDQLKSAVLASFQNLEDVNMIKVGDLYQGGKFKPNVGCGSLEVNTAISELVDAGYFTITRHPGLYPTLAITYEGIQWVLR